MEKIGLIDVDGHRWPNLCLMKLSAYHRARGDTVEWHDGRKHYNQIGRASCRERVLARV